MFYTDVAISSPSIKADRYHYKAVSNQKDWQNNTKMSSVLISILSLRKKGLII